jgi:hypothetical protein
MKAIHEFKNLTVSRSIGGDYYVEHDNGQDELILSPSGSAEHELFIAWIESPDREEEDFTNL